MNTSLASALRLALVATTLNLAIGRVAASDRTAADRAAQLLAAHSSLPVKNAGPYVERGTFRIQVAVKLGQPAAKLADGTWLYQNYQVADSEVRGTLVVRFSPQGRVSDLTLVTPAVATAMMAPAGPADKVLVATSR